MRIIYMGTPEFAVPPLCVLTEKGHHVGFVVTQPDKEKDRGKKLQATPVKEKALELGLAVLQPEKIRGNQEFFRQLEEFRPELIIVAAYGKILPKEILDLPEKGCINIHASLLPRFRGAAPIQRAIMEGDNETGVTLMYMEEGLDTGDMLAADQTPIARKNAGELHDELSLMGAELLRKNLSNIEKGMLERKEQNHSLATYSPMIFKQDGLIDFSKTPEEIERLIRGMDPWPGAHTTYKGDAFKIWQAEVVEQNCQEPPGTILEVTSEGIEISTGGKILLATVIQTPGKKRVRVSDYLKGNKIEKNIVLG